MLQTGETRLKRQQVKWQHCEFLTGAKITRVWFEAEAGSPRAQSNPSRRFNKRKVNREIIKLPLKHYASLPNTEKLPNVRHTHHASGYQ
jgi:hypothetical protein